MHADLSTLAILADLAILSARDSDASRDLAVLARVGAVAPVDAIAARDAIAAQDPEAARDLLAAEKAIAVRQDEVKYGRAGARKGRAVWVCVEYIATVQKNQKIVWHKLIDIEGDWSSRELAERGAREWSTEGGHRCVPTLRHGTAWTPRA